MGRAQAHSYPTSSARNCTQVERNLGIERIDTCDMLVLPIFGEMKPSLLLATLIVLFLPLTATASSVEDMMGDLGSIVKLGLLAVFVVALNIRAFYTNDVLHFALAINVLLLIVLWFKTDEDNMVFNLCVAALLLVLSVSQLVVSKRRG